MSTSALRTFFGRFLCNDCFSARAIICGNSVSPPKLSGNTPVADVVGPVKVCLFHSLGDQLDITALNRFYRRLNELVHFNKPLLLDHGFDGSFTSVMRTYVVRIILDSYKQSHFVQFLNNGFSCFIAIHTAELTAIFVDSSIIVHNIDFR